MALAETANLVVQLSLKGNITQGMNGARNAMRSLNAQTQRTQASLGKMVRNLKYIGAGVITGGAVALKWAGDFEASLNTINTVANVSAKQLSEIGDSILKLASDTGTPINDLTAAYYDLVSAGVKAADAQTILTQANKLGIGGLGTTKETVDLLTTAINSYGLKASEASKITDYFAQAIAAGKVTAAGLADSFSTVAPLAASAGIGIDELAAGYGQLTARGVTAGEAATQMRAAIKALISPTHNMYFLQGKLNKNFAEMAKRKGLAYTYNYIRKEGEKLGLNLSDLTGRIEGTMYALQVTGNQYDAYKAQLVAVRKAHEGLGVSAAQMQKREQGFNASLARLREIAKSTVITLAMGLLPGVTRVANAIGKLVQSHSGDIKAFGKDVGKMVDRLFTDKNVSSGITNALNFLKDLPWGSIRDGLKITGGAMKVIVDTFNSLPPDMKKLAIAALAINKVGGGIVTSGIRDILGLALNSLKTITATNVTVIGANVMTPGGGGAGLPLPGGGGAAGAVGGIKLGAAGVALALIGVPEAIRKNGETTKQTAERIVASNRAIESQLAKDIVDLKFLPGWIMGNRGGPHGPQGRRAFGGSSDPTNFGAGGGEGGWDNQYAHGPQGHRAYGGTSGDPRRNPPQSAGPQAGPAPGISDIVRNTGDTPRAIHGMQAIAQADAQFLRGKVSAVQAAVAGMGGAVVAKVNALQGALAADSIKERVATATSGIGIKTAISTIKPPVVNVYPSTTISATAVAGTLIRANSTNRTRVM